tara:strand:+ start:1375 stop:2835 length:1461 start_codon:yes stop_codon:yes gene_type:complete
LYYIKDKKGNKVLFKPNWAQQHLYDNLHYFNVILKARQLGFTTFVMIYFLDACLFNDNHSAGIIAHTQNDATDLFDNKIKYAYDNLPEWLRNARKAESNSARKLSFNNGSQIYTGVSLRSGTLQKLLVSEYGKISAKYPEKAEEIKTGALNTVEAGQQIFVESTAEGKSGEFYILYERARKLVDSLKKLARIEPKSFFYGWHMNPEYIAQPDEVKNYIISDTHKKYFDSLHDVGIELSEAQKVWYCLKSDQQGESITQEYPSTPDEAFQGSQKGAFYTKQMKKVRENGQITNLPYNPKHEVYTWWDLGLNDLMTIWFYQYIDGKHCFIDYHESSDEGWDYYATMLKNKGYNYASHNFPHDGNKRVRGKEVYTDKQVASQCGIRPIKVTPRTTSTYNDIINFCQPVLVNCWFDAGKCEKGILHLDNYRRKWSKADAMFTKSPEHDEASHGCDAFRTFAVNAEKIEKEMQGGKPKYTPPPLNGGGWMG